jgi:tRNA(fMet)-specific endonuclease VapC
LTPRYLLDTNIISDLMRNPGGRVAGRIGTVGEACICTSIFVAAELRFGAAKRNAPALAVLVDNILARIPVFPFEAPADRLYAVLRAKLESAGEPVGAFDFLIAAHAQALGCIMVTHNTREFSRIQDLEVEDWLV